MTNAASQPIPNGCNNCKRALLFPKGPSRKMRKLGSLDPQLVKLVACVKKAAQKTKMNRQKSSQAIDQSCNSQSTSDVNFVQNPTREDKNSNPQAEELLPPTQRLTTESENVRPTPPEPTESENVRPTPSEPTESENVRPTPSEPTEVGASPDEVINRSRRRRMLYADTGRPRPFYRRPTSSGSSLFLPV